MATPSSSQNIHGAGDTVPRIKLKIRLPTQQPAEDALTARKNKHQHQEDGMQHHAHVGGKRPFALLQQEDALEDQDDDDDDEDHQSYYDDDLSDQHDDVDDDDDDDDDTSIDTHRRISTSSATSTATTGTAAASRSSKKGKKKKNKQPRPKKRGRPTNKAMARAAAAAAHAAAIATSKMKKKDVRVICSKLLDTLTKRDAYGFFLEPVDTKVVRDYLTVIKEPMDFSTMKKKLHSNQYHTMQQFQYDFQLIVKNAKIYNAPNTIYWKSADKLEAFGLKAIERAEKQVQDPTPPPMQQPYSSATSTPPSLASTPLSITPSSSIWRRKSVKDEDIDIMSLESSAPPRKFSMTISSHKHEPEAPAKKKKKKAADAGVVYGTDGSMQAVHGVADIYALLPHEPQFNEPPMVTTMNPQALPSTFYQYARGYHDEWHSHRHFVQPAVFSDYGPFPFTTLGTGTPAMFYHPDVAHRVYAMYGDDTGEAYLASLTSFCNDVGLGKKEGTGSENNTKVADTASYLTGGAWNLVQPILDAFDPATRKLKEPLPACDPVHTEFGDVDVHRLLPSNASPATTAPATPATPAAPASSSAASAASAASAVPAASSAS